GAGRIDADELDAQPVVGQELRDGVAPLDEQHALAVLELVERQVDHVLLPVEAVEVDVRERYTAGYVLAHQRERRRGDVLGRAEPRGDPLHERRLAGAELAGQQEDIARPKERRERSAGGTGVVGGPGLEHQRIVQNSSSWSSAIAGCSSRSSSTSDVTGGGGGGGSGSASVRLISAKSSWSSPNCRPFSPPPRRIAARGDGGATRRPG